MIKKETKRKIVIPGEVVVEGDEYLPGEGTEKNGNKIISTKYGLAEEKNKLIRVIALSGVYEPRRGNVVIGKVENLTFNGWLINLEAPQSAFLPISEVPKYVSKGALAEVLDIGDMVVGKIQGVIGRNIDLTIKPRGLGKIEEGIIIKINSNKVPRVIGKEGSMINLIKEKTGCNVVVGQNGLIWIKGDSVENEILVKKAIKFVTEKSYINGLTDELIKWFAEESKK